MIDVRLKELVVVLAIAAAMFYLAKPIALRFIGEEDFSRRRLVWFFLTVVYFLSPNIWLYAAAAIVLYAWAGRKDTNPLGLYVLMLHVIPPVAVPIPVIGNNGLFDLDNYRLLSLCILIPVALRYRKNKERSVPGAFGTMDVMLLALGALEVALYVAPDLPNHIIIPDSPTNALRRAVLFMLDTYVLYYAVSRTCRSRRDIIDVAASYCLACVVMAAIAVFETTRSWLLYVDTSNFWGDPYAAFYLTRNGMLRAQVSAGHALALGFLLAIATGFWLYLKSNVASRVQRIGVTLLLWAGLVAAFSRGPWLGAVTIYFAFNAARPRALSRLVKSAAAALVILAIIAASPIGDRIFDVLPIMGRTADANILYREKLAERGWQLVMEHPFFGDQSYYLEMEDLRQGQGIIDIVNTYLGLGLACGLVGLSLFVGFILLAVRKVYSRARALVRSDPDLALFGAGLVACIAGTLVMIQSNSFNLGLAKTFYVLAGLATAYSRLNKEPQQSAAAVRAPIATNALRG